MISNKPIDKISFEWNGIIIKKMNSKQSECREQNVAFLLWKKSSKQNPPFRYDVDKLKQKYNIYTYFSTKGKYNGKTKLIKTNSIITIFRCGNYNLSEMHNINNNNYIYINHIVT